MLKRRSLCDGLCSIFQSSGVGEHMIEIRYENLITTALQKSPQVILLEVPECGLPSIAECLSISDEIKQKLPTCKILLMCSERDKVAVGGSIEAKKTGRVDDFVFFDTSVQYLTASLKAFL